MFAYYKEAENGQVSVDMRDKQTSIRLKCGHFSYAEIPKLYDSILGLAGTIEQMHPQMKKALQNYNLTKETYLPTLF